MSTIQNLRKSLVRNWRPVCSLVGDAPFPYPVPPASGGGWASPPQASSSLEFLSPFVLRTASSVFRPVNFLSLSLSHSLSCYLLLAPSDCPQGLRAGPYPKQCPPLLSLLPPRAGGGCGGLGYFSAGSCF